MMLSSKHAQSFNRLAVRELNGMEIDVQMRNWNDYLKFAMRLQSRLMMGGDKVKEIGDRTVDSDLSTLEKVPDADWEYAVNAAGCAFSIMGCGLSMATVADTFGVTWLLAASTCGAAEVQCVNTIRLWRKWKRIQDNRMGIKKANELQEGITNPGGGHDGAGSGSPSTGDGGAQGGVVGSEPALDLSCRGCSIDEYDEKAGI